MSSKPCKVFRHAWSRSCARSSRPGRSVGLLLGAASIVGVRAWQQPTVLATLVLCLLVLQFVAPRSIRPFALCAVAGCLVGAGAGALGGSRSPVPLATAIPRTLTATVVSDPRIEAGGASARVRWNDPTGTSRVSYAYLPTTPEVKRGQVVRVTGTVDGAAGERMLVSSLSIERDAGWIERRRYVIRSYLTTSILRYVPGSAGTLTLGLLIGDDSALTREEQVALRRSGLSHITAVSGWNVTMVTGTVGALFLALRLRGWVWTVAQLSALSAYVWIVGLDPPVTRAAIMVVIALIALRIGRSSHSATALVLAAAAMVLVTPGILGSLSFQLSMLATAALIAAAQVSAGWRSWRQVVALPALTSTFTGVATAPVLAATFGTVSLATIPANVLAGPLIPLATFGALFMLPLALVSPLAIVLGTSVWMICLVVLWIARVCAGLPFVFWEFAPLDATAAGLILTILLVVICAFLPEGRFIGRELRAWSQHEPGPAFAAGTALACVLVVALILT
jgi:competence protein ComEC